MRIHHGYLFVVTIFVAIFVAPFSRSASARDSAGAPWHAAAATAATCDRDCLYGFLDQYLKALAAKDPSGLPLAATVKFTENNVALKVGDGLWNTISGFGPYDIKFADTTAGQVGYLGVVREAHTSSPFALRMKIRGGKITEIETIVARPAGGNAVAGLDQYPDKQVLRDTLAPNERSPRAKMIALVNGYFDTLQQNNGTLHTDFDPDCNREENAMRSTNNPSNHIFPVTNLGCAGQFQEGYFRYDDRARDRRFPVVDEERGLVLAGMFLDHSGKLGMYKLTDGRELESPMRTPSTLCILELFKIKNGKILQIEAIMAGVPYNMPPVWGK
jgi:hypothetical protein